ncbi:retinol dehydrogenase 7-like [Hemicordylus capensis]|uniref:retinol dehydrogenase 7-like n=1 Tax=Hemicordylus capensis TaxID=884348 RepID=UPI002304A69B|nr:retinol dehydrogenase 7-like [Hemicordylus capensis]XP_053157852.1 retinol dehydrogenase 7-like [Hemicordylus capensis]
MWLYLAALVGLYFLHRWYRERQTVDNLTERYVFITGCDSGFGNQLARQLDIQGMQVLAACFTQKGAEQLEKATSERLKTTILDVTSTESVVAATTWVKGCVGNKGLWGLVNNAGIGIPMGPNECLTKHDFEKMINVNLLGVVDVTLHMLPLVKKTRGRVINVASTMGRIACFGGGYCPAKFGVEAFSDSLRRELRPFGVQVCIVEPGGFLTSIFNNLNDQLGNVWSQLPSDIQESYGQQYFENYFALLQRLIKSGSNNLYLVTDCIEHALRSSYPRTRYSAGWDAKFFYIPLSYMPTSVADYVVTFSLPKPAQAV